MKNIFSHFQSYEWAGEFWYPDKSLKLSGKLTYNPSDGIQLNFFCDVHQTVKETTYLYGILEERIHCTLFGEFNPEESGINVGKSFAYYTGRKLFYYAVFGHHISPNQLFSDIIFDFNDLQAFCFSQGFKHCAPHEEKKIYQDQNIQISTITECKLEKPHYSRFHSSKKVLKEIDKFFSDLKNRYPKTVLGWKADIRWFLKISKIKNKNLEESWKLIFSMCKLFSLLFFKPVRPIEIFIKPKNKPDIELKLLVSSYLDNKKLNILTEEKLTHEWMPIKSADLNKDIIGEWFKNSEQFILFSYKIANTFGIPSEYQTRAELILLCTWLEEIAYSHGKAKKKDKKYDFAIQEYDLSKEIFLTIRRILNLNKREEVGVALSEFRGEIAHLPRTKKYLEKVPYISLIALCKCIDLIITSYIYKKLGIADKAIKRFQNDQLRRYIQPNIEKSQTK